MKLDSVTRLLACIALVLIAANTPASAAPFSALYVFGDSLSDGGNNALVIGTDASQAISGNSYIPTYPYGSGTYSNGAVWVTPFAAGLGLSAWAAPSLAGGGDYAYGGARTATDGSVAGFPPSATTQLTGTGTGYGRGYLEGLSSVPSTALYVIAIGGDDVRDAAEEAAFSATPALTIAAAATAYAGEVGGMVDALQAKGAARIVVWDTPDVGKAPAAVAAGASFAALASTVASSFNAALSTRLAGEPGVSIFSIFALTDKMVAHPGDYDLTNATDACGAISGCDPSTYLFWDGLHPTSAGHAVIAASMLAAVPEPSTLLMFGLGLATLLAWRCRRA